MNERASRSNLVIHWNGPSNWDAQRQVEIVDEAVRTKNYGIVLNPASLFAINTAIGRALSSEIPVVILLDPIRIAPSPHLYFVLEDNQAGAALVAQRLKFLNNGQGEVAILGLNPLYPGSVDRFQALETALHQNLPGLRLDDNTAGPFGYGYLETAAEQVLRDHPHLDAIVALNSRSGLAAVEAIHASHTHRRVRVIAFDQSIEMFVLLRQGDVDSIVVPNARATGTSAVEDVIADRTGKSVPHIRYLEPMLVTKNNIDNEATQQFVLMR